MSDDDYYDLGTYRRPITARSGEAQRWFDRGLAWTYGYNHDEAVACYRRALDADPGCAMAWWGVAYAAGPNYNKPWEAFDEEDAARSLAAAHEAAARLLWPLGDTGLAKRLPRIRQPVMLLRGEDDRVLPASYAERFANALGGEVRTGRIPGAGHLADLDAPDETARRVLAFLDG